MGHASSKGAGRISWRCSRLQCTLISLPLVELPSCVFFSILLVVGTLSAADLAIAGSSTVYPAIAEAAKEYSAAKINVGQGGSTDGIKKVGDGAIAIAMSSRDLKDAEKILGLVATPIGKDGITLVVNKSNAVNELNSEQIIQAFTGTAATWSAIGGDSAPIVLVSPHEAHGTTEGFAHFFKFQFKGDGAAKTMLFAPKEGAYGSATAIRTATHQETAAKIATNRNALGFMPIGTVEAMVNKGTALKALTLNGVIPNTAAVEDGTWPITRPLLLITKGEPSPDAKAFIDFMRSPAGQAIMIKNGFVGVI